MITSLERYTLYYKFRQIRALSDIAATLNKGLEPTFTLRSYYNSYQKFYLYQIIGMESTIDNVVDFINSNFTPNFRDAYRQVLAINSIKDTETDQFWINVYTKAYDMEVKKCCKYPNPSQ